MSNKIVRTTGQFIPTAVDDNVDLWHVMPLWKLETFLNGGIWFARLDQFNTRYEGTLPNKNLGLLRMLLGNQSRTVQSQYEDIAQKAYASCWHMNTGEPLDEMWTEFNGEVAIKTSSAKMRELVSHIPACKNGGPAYFGQVNYINYATEMISDVNALYASFTVDDSFENVEIEARLLICTDAIPLNHKVYDYMTDDKRAIILPIDPKDFIGEIIIRASLDDHQANRVRQAIKVKGLGDKIKES